MYYGPNHVHPQNAYHEILTPKVMAFGDGAFERYLGLNVVMRVGAVCCTKSFYTRKKRDKRSFSLLLCEDTVRRWTSTSQNKGLHQEPSLAPWSWLGFPTSQIVKNQYLYFKPLSLWCLYMAACADKMQIFEWSFCIEDSIQVHRKRENLVIQVYMILY